MTPISDEGRKLAAELANAEGCTIPYLAADFSRERDTSLTRAFACLATGHNALKAEHEKAVADLREIDRLLSERSCSACDTARAIAATYRETDPLVAVFRALPLEGDAGCDKLTDAEWLKVAEAARFELARVKP